MSATREVLALWVALSLPSGCGGDAEAPPESEEGATEEQRTGEGEAHRHSEGEAPELTVVTDWCMEHGLPESRCTVCNPSLVSQFREAGDFCEEHGFPESACPICNPMDPPAGAEEAALEARIVRLVDPSLESAAGIEWVSVGSRSYGSVVECTARLAFDADRVADVRAIVPGIVRRLRIQLGQEVEAGDALFDLESTRVGEIQAALETARERVHAAEANVERISQLEEEDIASGRQLELARRELASATAEARAASATLRMAGAARSAPSGRYTLRAPLGGTIVRREAVLGMLATESTSLATIADTSIMWALCDVPENAASQVGVGQPVEVEVAGIDDARFEGEVTFVASQVDPRKRMVTARADVRNPEGRLRANQFAIARIETSATGSHIAVPLEAVQRVGEREVVFVRAAPGVYHPRLVRRRSEGDPVSIEGEVSEGDQVVTTGALLLRTEVMPGSIGAGCCEVESPGAD